MTTFSGFKENSHRIYLDHNATTPLHPQVIAEMPTLLQDWGNPSSVHTSSRGPKFILRETRRLFAEIFNCSPLEIIFNSGASEGNNTVLKSVWETVCQENNQENNQVKNEFIISAVEHPSVKKTAEYLQSLGAVVHLIPVNRDGDLDLDFIRSHLNSKTALVSCMFANNETGTLFPIKAIAKMIEDFNTQNCSQNNIKNPSTRPVLFHVDCVQALGKELVNLKELGVDYATFSAHKFYALKGCGVLYVKKSSPYINLVHGGGQERGRRGGTENILAIATLKVVLENLLMNSEVVTVKNQEIRILRDYLEAEIQKQISGITITAKKSLRVANTSSLVVGGVDGDTLLMSLDIAGFSISTGAACSSGNPEPSPVLLALGLSREEAQSSLRISLGWGTTKIDIDDFICALKAVIERVRLAHHKEMHHDIQL